MSTRAEIEKTAEKLPPQQKLVLMEFLGAQMRGDTNGHALLAIFRRPSARRI